MTELTEAIRGKWYPKMPPMLDGENDDAYTNRLTGAAGADRRPYDHRRNRQCSIGWHEECSDPRGESCECPCHREGPVCGPCNGCGHVWLRNPLWTSAADGVPKWIESDETCPDCGGSGIEKASDQ